MRTYIAGPMSGIPNYNFDLFTTVSKALMRMGREVYNPATSFQGRQDLPYDMYLREAVRMVSLVDDIVLLPGWEESKGALTEVHVGLSCGLRFYLWKTNYLQPLPMSYESLSYLLNERYRRDG